MTVKKKTKPKKKTENQLIHEALLAAQNVIDFGPQDFTFDNIGEQETYELALDKFEAKMRELRDFRSKAKKNDQKTKKRP